MDRGSGVSATTFGTRVDGFEEAIVVGGTGVSTGVTVDRGTGV